MYKKTTLFFIQIIKQIDSQTQNIVQQTTKIQYPYDCETTVKQN